MSVHPDTLPDYGPRLVLTELPVERLFIDPRYQRSLTTRASQKVIDTIAGGFRWSKFGAIDAMPWPDRDGWAVLDGQHRTEAARRRHIDTVPALIHPPMSPEEAAAIFVGINLDRVAMHPLALHHARVAAGDAAAVELDAICARAGVSIGRYAAPYRDVKPGVTNAVGTIYAAVRRFGAAAAEAALTLLAEAFAGQKNRLRSEVILGVAAAVATDPGGNRAALSALLRSKTKGELGILIEHERVDGTGAWLGMRDLALRALRENVKPAPAVSAPPQEPREVAAHADLARHDDGPPDRPPPKAQESAVRKCLGCGTMFTSTHVGNRQCFSCRKRTEGIGA